MNEKKIYKLIVANCQLPTISTEVYEKVSHLVCDKTFRKYCKYLESFKILSRIKTTRQVQCNDGNYARQSIMLLHAHYDENGEYNRKRGKCELKTIYKDTPICILLRKIAHLEREIILSAYFDNKLQTVVYDVVLKKELDLLKNTDLYKNYIRSRISL